MTEANAAPSARRLAGGTAVLLGVRAAGLVMGLVVSMLLARGLGAEDLGTFATGLALVHIGSMLTDFGLGALLVREGAGSPHLRAAMLRWATRARIGAGVLVFAALTLVTIFLIDGTENRLSVLLVVSAVPLSALTLGMTLLQQRLMLNRMALLLLVQSVAWLVMVGALFVQDAGLRSYALAFVVYNAAYGLLVYRVARRALDGPSESMTLAAFSRLMRDVVPLSLTVLLVTLYYKLDSIFVYQFAGAAAAGSYAIAYRFLDQLQIIPVTLGNLFLPLLTRRYNADQPTQPMFDRYLRLTLVLSVPVAGLGMTLAGPLVALFGTDFGDAVVLMRILLPAFVIVATSYVVVHIAIVHRQAKKQLRAACVGLAVNVALNLILVPRYGARAAAGVTLLTEAGVVLTLYLSLRHACRLHLPWAWLTRLSVVVAAATAVAALVSAAAGPYAAATAFALVYVAAGALLSIVDVDETRALLRRTPAAPDPSSADAREQPRDLVAEVAGPEH